MATAEITGGRLKLTGDGFGYAAASRQLPTTPVGAKRMQFFYRIFLENATATTYESSMNWDNTFCFGLSFDGVWPYYIIDDPYAGNGRDWTGFIGPVSIPSYDVDHFDPTTSNLAIVAGTDGDYASLADVTPLQNTRFMGSEDIGTSGGYAFSMANSSEDTPTPEGDAPCWIPANATFGAEISYGWDIWQNPDDSIEMRCAMTADSLADDAIDTIFDAGVDTSLFDRTVTIDTTRAPLFLSGSDIVFPSYVMFRWPMKAQSLQVEHYKIRYWEYSV